ncbi:hypothetical protein GOP47_0014360 [Adiantum capillus-veneris]|uniref:Pentatricopeptide repeat-containing protein n=1 Tax=Adiantum capillus-veneris TaxID=13818 RepID=A0A9D4UM56_ADICA|nr:hypothetical protein GOP47_0014360 [Adiantum capillus-veneris]
MLALSSYLPVAIPFVFTKRSLHSASDIANLLRCCIKAKDLSQGKLAHDFIVRNSLEHDASLRSLLLHLYGHCAALQDASVLFGTSGLSRESACWNSVVRANARHGSFAEAMHFFGRMCQKGFLLDKLTLISILSSTISHGALDEGKLLHSYVAEGAFYTDVFVGTTLINLHGKWGSLSDARFVFNNLQNRDTIAWNTMIAAYAQSFSTKGDLLEGKQLHVLANETSLDEELVVATAILTMYGKCSDPEDTRRMFDRIHKHDAVSWNTMIGAYAADGQRSKALQLFEQMQKEGVKPDKVSFLSILEAFSGEEALTKGKNMHESIAQSGYELDVVVGTALINMYGRCGSPEDAWMMFDKMPQRNAYTWNSMIAAFAQNARGLRAIQLFKQMQEKGFKPDRFTLLSMLNSCAAESEIEEILASISNSGDNLDDVSGSALMYLFSKCGSLAMAQDVFNRVPQPSLVLINAMIAALARNGQGRRALQLYKQMQLQGFLPDKDSYVYVLDAFEDEACCQLERFSEALELFERMHKGRFQPDRVTFVCILSACTSPATLTQGKCIHTLIVQSGQDSNVVVANALLNMYCRCGCVEDSLAIFRRIQFCDSVTYASVLSACANWSLLPEGKEIHASIMGTEIENDIIVGNSLITLYGKCGSLKEAQLIFDRMLHRDTVTWTVMVAAYAQQGKGSIVLQLLNKMLREAVQPNEITFVNILCACCHDGLVYEACHYFYSMKCLYGVLPLVHHYDCLVDLFARAGRLEEAENLIRGMPFPATAVSWTTLLSACKCIADVERGEWAAEQAFHLDPENYTPYLILRNIYGAAGNTNDSSTVVEQIVENI